MQLQTCAICQDKGRIITKVIQRPTWLPHQFQGGEGTCGVERGCCFRFNRSDSSHPHAALEEGGWGRRMGNDRALGVQPYLMVLQRQDYPPSEAGKQSIKAVFKLQDRMLFALLGFWNYSGSDSLFFLPVFPFWNGNVYPLPVPPLYLGST